jgi:hypothetical protein
MSNNLNNLVGIKCEYRTIQGIFIGILQKKLNKFYLDKVKDTKGLSHPQMDILVKSNVKIYQNSKNASSNQKQLTVNANILDHVPRHNLVVDATNVSNIVQSLRIQSISKTPEKNTTVYGSKIGKSNSRKIENYGIIKGHGSTIQDKICIIPKNLKLGLYVHKGDAHKHIEFFNENTVDLLKNKQSRGLYLQTVSEPVILEGDTPILDILINFSPGYSDKGSETKNNNSNIASYSFIGIITGNLSFIERNMHSISKRVDKKMNHREMIEMVKYESMIDHNNNIIPIDQLYKKNWFLSDILKIISSYKKIHPEIPSTYILMTCRSYIPYIPGITANNSSPRGTVPELMRHNSFNDTFKIIFSNFCNRIEAKIFSDITTSDEILELIEKNFDYLCKNNSIYKTNFNFLYNYLTNNFTDIQYMMTKYFDILDNPNLIDKKIRKIIS